MKVFLRIPTLVMPCAALAALSLTSLVHSSASANAAAAVRGAQAGGAASVRPAPARPGRLTPGAPSVVRPGNSNGLSPIAVRILPQVNVPVGVAGVAGTAQAARVITRLTNPVAGLAAVSANDNDGDGGLAVNQAVSPNQLEAAISQTAVTSDQKTIVLSEVAIKIDQALSGLENVTAAADMKAALRDYLLSSLRLMVVVYKDGVNPAATGLEASVNAAAARQMEIARIIADRVIANDIANLGFSLRNLRDHTAVQMGAVNASAAGSTIAYAAAVAAQRGIDPNASGALTQIKAAVDQVASCVTGS